MPRQPVRDVPGLRRCPSPTCDGLNPARARYCGQCGCALYRPPAAVARQAPISAGVAYGLWALCLAGAAGIHRFYLGRYVTGAVWLLTWGLLGVGSFFDLFLIPGMVEKQNRDWAAAGWTN
ncbi:MAG: NINE protein [Phycisphaerae bacterium]|jgi:TM2 domain-containing membrane protein YozV